MVHIGDPGGDEGTRSQLEYNNSKKSQIANFKSPKLTCLSWLQQARYQSQSCVLVGEKAGLKWREP